MLNKLIYVTITQNGSVIAMMQKNVLLLILINVTVMEEDFFLGEKKNRINESSNYVHLGVKCNPDLLTGKLVADYDILCMYQA